MKSSIKSSKRCGFRSEEGSFTLEASMVFPVIFVALIAMVMFSMYMYQKVVIYYAASISAERSAFQWNNSKRDAMSGIGITGEYDGLYWRMSGNGALQSLFGYGDAAGDSGGLSVAVGGTGSGRNSEESSSLPVVKISKIGARIPQPFEGEINYSYGLMEKRIEVKLRQPISIPILEKTLGRSEPSSISRASIVDPVELIRNVDLVRYYTAKINRNPGGAAKRQQAAQVLIGRQSLEK
ncbi:pilus assembly protein [Paenibacillus sp. sptzw28]|uniref:TadE/TadG family type IV pilus assembly protein n=1 Tax=Paenibacillus sp. sptzw28 TaxID=715179 RepID=UPI001C6EBA33|nr:TadE family protein [Paenibacillus sp. sptzw28]QYR20673.1 pilus assembly protein [Paenibacillus sp. sptzw28]